MVRDAALSFDRENGTRLAAQLGFYTLIAFPALLLIAVWILGKVFGSPEVRADLVDAIMNALPLEAVEGRREIASLLNGLTSGAGGLGLFSVLVLFFSGSSAVGAVRQAVETSQGPDAKGRRFPKSKLFDIGVTAATMPFLLIVVGVSISKDISSLVSREPVLDLLARLSGGGLAIVAVGMLIFAWLYWVQNPGERTWASALVGGLCSAALCSAVWLALKVWFGITGGGSAVYGVLAGFIGLLLFLHLACIVIVFGAHLSASFRRHRSGEDVVPVG